MGDNFHQWLNPMGKQGSKLNMDRLAFIVGAVLHCDFLVWHLLAANSNRAQRSKKIANFFGIALFKRLHIIRMFVASIVLLIFVAKSLFVTC